MKNTRENIGFLWQFDLGVRAGGVTVKSNTIELTTGGKNFVAEKIADGRKLRYRVDGNFVTGW